MDFLLFFVLASLGGAALVAFVIVQFTNRASHKAITSYFKASEFILEHHRPPPEWTKPVPGRWLRARSLRPFGSGLAGAKMPPALTRKNKLFRRRIDSVYMNGSDLLARLDELIDFFENCSFFEDEFAREQLLLKLRQEREDWRSNLQI